MPCVALPDVPIPTLPSPLTLGATLPVPELDLTLCCNVHVPLPVTVPAFLATLMPTILTTLLSGYVDQVTAFIDSIQPRCPLD